MKLMLPRIFAAIAFSLPIAVSAAEKVDSVSSKNPNVIIVVANDLGIGDLGIYGQQKIETPNIDALAREGMRFSKFYSGAPSDAASLGILLTGKHAGHAAIRGTDEWAERGKVTNYVLVLADSTLEGQRPLPASERTIADLMKENGYTTGMFGVWGLGSAISEGAPTKHGFDAFYGYDCLRQAQTYYPKYLWRNTQKVSMDNPLVFPNMKLATNADPDDEASYAFYTLDHYAPDSIFAESIKFVKQNSGKPFFMVLASPMAKGPLQVPYKWVSKYKHKFGEEKPYLGFSGGYPNRIPRATFAGMVSYFDYQVGELVEQLKKDGIYNNTIIVFVSDNGATLTNGVDGNFFKSAGDYPLSTTKGKNYLYEAGIRVPFFVVWPGQIAANTTSDQVGISYDIYPTIARMLELDIPSKLDGISLWPTLMGEKQTAQHDYLYWENTDNTAHQAIISGKWKLLGRNMSFDEPDFELYDLVKDPTEQNDLSQDNPDVVRRLQSLMFRVRVKPSQKCFYLNYWDVQKQIDPKDAKKPKAKKYSFE